MESVVRALVADDDPVHREIFADLMRESGIEVATASDGVQAVAMIEAHDFEIVLSDLIMPGKDGIEVLKASRNKNPDALVIIITGFGTLETALEAIKLGAYNYITKPFSIETLQLLFKNVKERIRLVRSNRELRNRLGELLDEIDELKKERESYLQQMEESRQRLDELEHNLSALLHQFPFLLNPNAPVSPLEVPKWVSKESDQPTKTPPATGGLTLKV
jgi:DNA-binding NtrC family response regulator